MRQAACSAKGEYRGALAGRIIYLMRYPGCSNLIVSTVALAIVELQGGKEPTSSLA